MEKFSSLPLRGCLLEGLGLEKIPGVGPGFSLRGSLLGKFRTEKFSGWDLEKFLGLSLRLRGSFLDSGLLLRGASWKGWDLE